MLPNTDRQWEEGYLKQTLQVIGKNLENYRRETARMQADIDEMLEHYHDNDAEVWTILNNTITLNEHMKMALSRNERAVEKPYFGRIIFRDETLGVEESLYIGKGGISRDTTHQMVIDWRAPVANAYYENGLGKCSYQAPDGKPIPIDLKLKRTYEIADGRLTDYFDTEVVATDELLMKYLSRNKQAVLGEIVATIQKEQNEIIRKSPFHNMIVQGVAGSGKTTVAMHRISFILYNYQERFRPEDFYIVGSNRILLNYITGVLPDLDVHGVRQMTMEQLFVRLLYEDWDDKKYRIKPTGGSAEAVKGTSRWFHELTAFIRRLEQSAISQETVTLNPRQFVEGLENGKNGVYDRRLQDRENGISPKLVELLSGDAVKRYVSQNPEVSIQSKINMLNERLLSKVHDEFLGKGVKYTEAEKKAILKEYRGFYGKRTWKQSIFSLYEEFLRDQQQKGCQASIPTDSFDVYDLAALALLYKLVKETEIISEAHHIVIDEAQDFGMMAYLTLNTCIRDCTYTIMGDVSQNIHFGYGLSDWEELRRLLLTDSADCFGLLRKSYRNTVEISDYATAILRHGDFSVYPAEPIIRHGSPVLVRSLSAPPKTDPLDFYAGEAAKVCRGYQEKGYGTIAVICRGADAAASVSRALAKHIDIVEGELENMDFGNGIMVLPVEYTKGLEFDAVLIWNPSREDYPLDNGHARLLYVAATRALHELCILHWDRLTGLITEPVLNTDMSQLPGAAPDTEKGKERERAKTPIPQRQRLEAAAPIRPSRPVIHTARTTATAVSSSGGALVQSYSGRQNSGKAPARTGAAGAGAAVSCASGFGDMPSTEQLRPAGHSRINQSIKWVSKQEDGLYLQSQYGTLRLSPVSGNILRITFSRNSRILDGTHPAIAIRSVSRDWKFRDSARTAEYGSRELLLVIDKVSGSIQFLSGDRQLLVSEHRQESRQLEGSRSWLYLDWQKKEQLFALGPAGQSGLALKNTAKIISSAVCGKRPDDGGQTLPLLISDRGYGIIPATAGQCIFCDLPSYGSYLSMEAASGQMDYYFLSARQQTGILNAYAYLCGLL